MTDWNQRNRVFVQTYEKLNGLVVDAGLAGEECFTSLDKRNWPLRNLSDGRQCFITNNAHGATNGIDVFWMALDTDEPIPDGYWMPWGSSNRVFYPYNTKAVAACDGKVKHCYYMGTGLLCILEHANMDQTGYFHGLKDTAEVKQGDSVVRGQPLFTQGWDIRRPLDQNNGIHLHFTVKRDGVYLNPRDWLQYAEYLDMA